MDEITLKMQIYKAFESRNGEFELLKAQAEKFILAVLADAKEVIKEIPDIDDALRLLVEIVDDKTHTGMLDILDGTVAKMIIVKITNENMHRWYSEKRAEILKASEDAGI